MTHQPDGDRPAAGGAPWGLADAVVGYLAAVVLSALFGVSWIAFSGDRTVSLGVTVSALVGQWLGLVGAAVVVSRRKGTGSLSRDFGLRIEAADVRRGVVVGVLCQLALLPLLYLPFLLLDPDLDLSAEAREVTELGRGPGFALLAACLIVGAPIAEELFFRGLLQQAVTARHGPRWGVAVSAVAFGLTHFQPLQTLGLVAFGVVLGVLTERACRLGPAVVAHMAFNATTVVLLAAF